MNVTVAAGSCNSVYAFDIGGLLFVVVVAAAAAAAAAVTVLCCRTHRCCHAQRLVVISLTLTASSRSQDIMQKWPAKKDADVVTLKKKNHVWTFNGVTSIRAKVAAAIDHGAGALLAPLPPPFPSPPVSWHVRSLYHLTSSYSAGVMIWEVGQDCRYPPFTARPPSPPPSSLSATDVFLSIATARPTLPLAHTTATPCCRL